MINDSSNESPLAARGIRQIYVPRRQVLARFAGPATGGALAPQFTVQIPDSRIHWKISILAISDVASVPGSAVLSPRGCSIWVAGLDADQVMGVRGTPVTNIEGQGSALTPFPNDAGVADPDLGGMSFENDGTSVDAVQVRILIPAGAAGPAGALIVQTRFQPNVGSFIPIPEWEEIKSQCTVDIDVGPVAA